MSAISVPDTFDMIASISLSDRRQRRLDHGARPGIVFSPVAFRSAALQIFAGHVSISFCGKPAEAGMDW
jgi:hypothetical protein